MDYSPFSGYSKSSNSNKDGFGSKLTTADFSKTKPTVWKDAELVADTVNPEGWRKEQNITVIGENCPAPMTKFDCLGTAVPPQVHKSFQRQGFQNPTVIQAQSWPILFQHRDVVGIAKTGSGKTLAFMIPAIVHVLAQPSLQRGDGPSCVVLAPTRELAQQIDTETRKVLPPSLRAVCIYGGSSKGPQIQQLSEGVHILVATPGRLIDFLEIQKTNLLSTSFLVLDEADRMLDMGFEPQVRAICSQIRDDRQTLLFSATWPTEIQDIAKSFQRNFIRINVGSTELLANPDVTQHIVFCRDDEKFGELRKIMKKFANKRILIFSLYKKTADQLERQLRAQGVNAFSLHGDKEQAQREWILNKLRTENCTVVATDVAARGLDIKELEVVINYEFPLQVDDYVHRIGRTGRAGAKGDAYTILTQRENHISAWMMSEVVKILEQAKQVVPSQLASWAARGGGGPPKPKPGFGRNQKIPSLTYHGGSRPTTQLSGQKTGRDGDGPASLFGVSTNPKRQTFSIDSSDDDEPVQKKGRAE